MTDPQFWWYVSRASAIVAWSLLTATVLWGVLLSTRVLRAADNPAWLKDLHRYLSGTAIVMTLVHVGSLLLDPYLRDETGFGPVAALVPFASEFRPLPLALGIVALYLMAAVALSSLMMRVIPRRAWKAMHFASYAVVALVAFHAAFAGSDTGTWWYIMVSTALIVATMLAVVVRQVVGSVAAQRQRAAERARQVPQRNERLRVVVAERLPLAEGVLGLRLAPEDGGPVPVWAPGSHLTLHLPNGLERQYSLCGDPADRRSFDIAVQLSERSAGGSRFVHESLRVGEAIEVGPPRNHFELEPARDYLFIAGGIGITALTSMIASLPASRHWSLVYLGRSRRSMPFVNLLESRYPGRVRVHAADEQAGRYPAAAEAALSSAQVYACGPAGLMDELTAAVPAERLHIERFVPADRAAGIVVQPVHVQMPGVGSFQVPADRSILDVLEDAGAPVTGSCRKGVCGTCELRVLGGTPLHLDSVTDDAAKDAAGVMYPCVSRALSPELSLDL
ncbi:2Fe-2S iron-sulfur cluster-binding protein [Agromyces sp. H66]|uniref:2Fe-2S iron-sulfur cluster-binding protein n=1 Tax=Agromyces sp. H66 TaxID=2529859 RepID=UPI0010AA0D51|nr:2Fe-2S iron-sulfur cluster-binding protein [Agromyces sp. H66]